MSGIWLNWDEIRAKSKGRNIVFFGAAEVYIRQGLPHIGGAAFIVDNDEKEQGSTIEGLEVKPPRNIAGRSAEFFIIITSGSYPSIAEELNASGYAVGEDYACAPVIDNTRALDELYSTPRKLLLTCQDHSFYKSTSREGGGGLYVLDVVSGKLDKKLDGNFRQICDTGSHYLISDELQGPLVVSYDFEVVRRFGQAETAKACGIDYDRDRDLIFVANTKRDAVSVYDGATYQLAREIPMSRLPKKTQHNHHINDLCVHEGYLYVSMFSLAGCLQQWAMDGGVIQFDIDNPENRFEINLNAWMPHSIQIADGKLSYVESMNGRLMRNPRDVVCDVPGFIRGFRYKDGFYYIGQSEFRYLDRINRTRNFTIAESGVYIHQVKSTATRFISLPALRQLHDILILE